MGTTIFELWFDFSCPYAYLASRVVDRLAAHGVTIDWRPMLLGGVFRGIGAGDGPMATLSPQKAVHNLRDMHRWADVFGVPFQMPPSHPMRTVRALRALLAVPHDQWPQAIAALYAAYWQRAEDITSDAVIAAALIGAGVDGQAALAGADAKKDELFARTQEAISLGIFGAPAWVIRGVRPEGSEPILVWGQDRLPWLEALAQGWDPEAGPPPGGPHPIEAAPRGAADAAADPPLALDVYFDVSSPFSYLALTQLPALAATATVRIVPILLGGLFRDIGTANVPLFAMPPPKLAYITKEMARWARWWGVPFATPSKFPQRTITAQRLIVLAAARSSESALTLATALGRAMWAEQKDIEDPAVLRAILESHTLDPALVEHTQEPAIKAALVANTEEARTRGVFGVPTFIVDDRLLFWGQDRLDLVARALAGWVPHMEADAPVVPRS